MHEHQARFDTQDVMRTHPDMHFFSGDDGDAVLHRQVAFHNAGNAQSCCSCC